jgi:hypothetical protein
VLHVARPVADVARELGLDAAAAERRLEAARATLFEARGSRTYPGLDDKILTSWNGLMIGSFAYCGRVLNEPRYVEAARRGAGFVMTEMKSDDGRLLRTHRAGQSKIPGFLDDQAFLADACLDLYEATFDLRWFREAAALARAIREHFAAEGGGWYHTADDSEELITRSVSPFDGAEPSGNGVAAQVMVRLAKLTGDAGWRESAERALKRFGEAIDRQPGGTAALLLALDALIHEDGEIAFVGDPASERTRALVRPVLRAYLPGTVFALRAPDDEEAAREIPLLEGKGPVDGAPAVYVCRNFACQAPVTSPEEVATAVAGR